MKRYVITYEIVFTVEADDVGDAKEKALRKVEGYLDEPDDLRNLLQTAVMDAGPIIREVKEGGN